MDKLDLWFAEAGGEQGPQGPQGADGQGAQGPQGASGSVGPIPMCNHVSPEFHLDPNDGFNLIFDPGRYYALGHRVRGLYQNPAGAETYWDFETSFTMDIEATYSAGSTSGCVDPLNAPTRGEWIGLYVVGENEVMGLPITRVYAVDYNITNAGKTTITLGTASNDSEDDEALSTNDSLNDYQLVRLPTYALPIPYTFTIEDTITGATNYLVLDGDQTAYISWTDTIMVIPPSNVPCVYTGSIFYTKIYSTILPFSRRGWYFQWNNKRVKNMRKSTTIGDIDFGDCWSPLAVEVELLPFIGGLADGNLYTSGCAFHIDNAGGGNLDDGLAIGTMDLSLANYFRHHTSYNYRITGVGMTWHPTSGPVVRNHAIARYSTTVFAAPQAYLHVQGWRE